MNRSWNMREQEQVFRYLGFGNVLWKGVKEAVDANGFLGLFQGGFKASAVGISAALIFRLFSILDFRTENEKIVHVPEYV